MNKDFPRILRLLRKERGLKQKEAADSMGIAQALLSHYENGKRECGLDFLIQASEFYGVSADYLLGRTGSRTGTVIAAGELPESTVSESFQGSPKNASVLLRKKLITNSLEVIFSLLIKSDNTSAASAVGSYLMTAVYRAYRMLFSIGGDNDENSFSIPPDEVAQLCAAKMSLDEIKIRACQSKGTKDEKITSSRIESEFVKQSTALFSVINNAENDLKKLK